MQATEHRRTALYGVAVYAIRLYAVNGIARTLMHGFLNIDKPAGITSHDVVARVRRSFGQKRVGHAGTLDPAATGVLVVALGAATRLIEYVQDQTSKRYMAAVHLGATTDTDDAEGRVLAERPVPALEGAAIEAVLAQFRGQIQQVPPMYAAIHHEGKRLHELARAGVTVERAARPVTIERLDVLAWQAPVLTIDVLCGKGTYIRSLARDIGEALGCGAHLGSLRRTAVGAFRIEDAVPLDVLEEESRRRGEEESLLDGVHAVSSSPLLPFFTSRLLPPEVAVADWPAVHVDEIGARRLRNGLALRLDEQSGEQVRVHSPDGELLALLARAGEHWRPIKVFDWTSP